MKNHELKVIAGTSHPALAQAIAKHLHTEQGQVEIKRFNDGEQYTRYLENIRGTDLFLIQSTSKPVSENLMELLILIDAAKRASANRITVVMPYFGYARQDRKAASREPITAKLAADLLTTAGAHRVLALDLHSGQIQGFFNIPVDNLTATPKLVEYVKQKKLSDLVIVAPDAGSAKNSTKVAKALDVELVIINKTRSQQGIAQALHVIGNVKEKNCLIFDDLIDTAGTICAAADALKKEGCKSITVCATHGIFSAHALERIEKSGINEVIVTDSIPPVHAPNAKVTILTIADLFAEAIQRIHSNESVNSLFDGF